MTPTQVLKNATGGLLACVALALAIALGSAFVTFALIARMAARLAWKLFARPRSDIEYRVLEEEPGTRR